MSGTAGTSLDRFHANEDEEAPAMFPKHSSREIREDSIGEEEREWLLRRQEQPGWRVDNGAMIYQQDREKKKRAYLVETGRCVSFHGSCMGV